jgi:rhodanese-related sulfurtransferase
MHRQSEAPFVDIHVDDGESLVVGQLRLELLHTPGHTIDSMCVVLDDRVLTGDTLLINGTGRTDLPTGDPYMLYDSLFSKLLKLDAGLKVFPAHNYRDQSSSTLGDEIANNPRLQKKERQDFADQMKALELDLPQHLTEALRTNRSGGKTVAQLIADAATRLSFMSMRELDKRIGRDQDLVVLDVREAAAYERAHIPGALHVPRGQLELRVNEELPDPTQRVVVYCQMGKISTLAAATLHDMGFRRAVALDGGLDGWNEAGLPTENGGRG